MVRLFLISGAAKAPCATPFLGGWGLHRYDKSMSNDKFSVEESAALLHAIFPNYPDMLGMKPAPEVGAFLWTLRAGEPWQTGVERTSTNQIVCQ